MHVEMAGHGRAVTAAVECCAAGLGSMVRGLRACQIALVRGSIATAISASVWPKTRPLAPLERRSRLPMGAREALAESSTGTNSAEFDMLDRQIT